MGFLRTFFGSFYSPALYQAVARRPGYALGYGAWLTALTTVLIVIWSICMIHQALFAPRGAALPFFDDLQYQIAEQAPLMTLNKGELRTKYPRATVVHIRSQLMGQRIDEDLITVDTTGETTVANMKTPILVTAKEVIIVGPKGAKNYAISELMHWAKGPLVINHAVAESVARGVIHYVHSRLPGLYLLAGLAGAVILGLIFYMLRLVMVGLLGLLGMAIARLCTVPMNYGRAMRLAGVSFTPVTSLATAGLLCSGYAASAPVLLLCGFIMLLAALMVSADEPLAAAA